MIPNNCIKYNTQIVNKKHEINAQAATRSDSSLPFLFLNKKAFYQDKKKKKVNIWSDNIGKQQIHKAMFSILYG